MAAAGRGGRRGVVVGGAAAAAGGGLAGALAGAGGRGAARAAEARPGGPAAGPAGPRGAAPGGGGLELQPSLEGKDYGKSRMRFSDFELSASGLQYKDLRGGEGPAAANGQDVVVDCESRGIPPLAPAPPTPSLLARPPAPCSSPSLSPPGRLALTGAARLSLPPAGA